MHRQFYERRQSWFEVVGDQHFVMWWVPEGHRPDMEEALARLDMLRDHGSTDAVFGWDRVDMSRWRKGRCDAAAS